MIPYITFPTSQPDEEIAYGMGFPLSVGLSEALGAGAQFQFDFVPNDLPEYLHWFFLQII